MMEIMIIYFFSNDDFAIAWQDNFVEYESIVCWNEIVIFFS